MIPAGWSPAPRAAWDEVAQIDLVAAGDALPADRVLRETVALAAAVTVHRAG